MNRSGYNSFFLLSKFFLYATVYSSLPERKKTKGNVGALETDRNETCNGSQKHFSKRYGMDPQPEFAGGEESGG